MVKLVLGLTGTIGSGKDTAANYLKQEYDAFVISMGDLVREEVAQFGLESSRENQQDIANKRRREFGENYWIKKVTEKIISVNAEIAVINGIRTIADASVPKDVFKEKFKLILLETPVEVRFARLQARQRAGDPKTLEDFQKQEESEWEKFNFADTFKLADLKIQNNSAIENLNSEIDKVIKQFLG